MQRRTRKLVGTIAMLVFVCVYALVVMGLAKAGRPEIPKSVKLLFYAAVGIGWVIPLMPLVWWMERKDKSEA
nr:MAG: DUF2842 domain-containing protein [Pseudomonadota bacterium]